MNRPNTRGIWGKISQCFAPRSFVALCTSLFLLTAMSTTQAQFCTPDFDATYGCGSNTSIEVFGCGMHDSAQVTVPLPNFIDVNTVDSIFVEVIAKGPFPLDSFSTLYIIPGGTTDTCFIDAIQIESRGSQETAVAYRTSIAPASEFHVVLSDPSDAPLMEGVAGFAVRQDQACVGGTTQLRGLLLFYACDTIVFNAANETNGPRDVRIQIPISELGDVLPNAECVLEFTFRDNGMDVLNFRDTLFGPQVNIKPYFTVYDTTLMGLPGTTDELEIRFISPGIPGGPGIDSLICEIGLGDSYIVGSVVIEASCPVGDCCEITCAPPDTIFELCQFEYPPIPPSLQDSVSTINGMGQNSDSLAWVDTVGGMFAEVLCDYFIIYDSMQTNFVPNIGGGTVCITRFYGIYRDSAGTFVLDGSCTQTFCVTSFNDIELNCPPDTAVCEITEVPPYMNLDEFLAAGYNWPVRLWPG